MNEIAQLCSFFNFFYWKLNWLEDIFGAFLNWLEDIFGAFLFGERIFAEKW